MMRRQTPARTNRNQTSAASMTTPSTLLRMMWLASPALPVGGFSYSEGLESAVDSGRVNDELSARNWLLDQLTLGLARADLPAAAQAFSAWQLHDIARATAFGWPENMVQAAMKSVPLEQLAAQRMLARLVQAIPDEVERALALPDDARQAFTPMLAILSAQHETQYSRLFRS